MNPGENPQMNTTNPVTRISTNPMQMKYEESHIKVQYKQTAESQQWEEDQEGRYDWWTMLVTIADY